MQDHPRLRLSRALRNRHPGGRGPTPRRRGGWPAHVHGLSLIVIVSRRVPTAKWIARAGLRHQPLAVVRRRLLRQRGQEIRQGRPAVFETPVQEQTWPQTFPAEGSEDRLPDPLGAFPSVSRRSRHLKHPWDGLAQTGGEGFGCSARARWCGTHCSQPPVPSRSRAEHAIDEKTRIAPRGSATRLGFGKLSLTFFTGLAG